MGCMRWGSVLCVVVGVGASGGVLGQEFSPKLTGSATLEWGISYGKGVGSHGQAPGAVMGTGPYNLKHGFRTTNTVGVSFPLVMRTTHTRRGQHPALYAELKVADLQADLSQGKAGFAVKRKGKVEATLHCYGAYLTIGKNPTFLTNFARLWKPWVTAQYQEDAVQYAPGFGGLGGKVGYRAQDIGGSGVSLDVGFLSFASNGAWDSTDPTHSKYGFGADLKLMYARAGHPLCTVELASNVTLEDGYLIGAQKDANNQNKDKLLWNVGGRLTLEPGAGFRFSFALDAGNQHQSAQDFQNRTQRAQSELTALSNNLFQGESQKQEAWLDEYAKKVLDAVTAATETALQSRGNAYITAVSNVKVTPPVAATLLTNLKVFITDPPTPSPLPALPAFSLMGQVLLQYDAEQVVKGFEQVQTQIVAEINQKVQAAVAQSKAAAQAFINGLTKAIEDVADALLAPHKGNPMSLFNFPDQQKLLKDDLADLIPKLTAEATKFFTEGQTFVTEEVKKKTDALDAGQQIRQAIQNLRASAWRAFLMGVSAVCLYLDTYNVAFDALLTAQWKWLSSGIYFATAPANVFGTRVLDNTIASCGDFAGFLKLETKSGDPYTHLLTGLDAGVETRVYIPLTHDLYKNNNGNPLPSGGSSGHIGLPVVGKAWCSYRIPVQDYGWVKPSVTVHASTNRAHLNAPAAGGAVGATYLTKEYCAQLRAGVSASLIEKTVFSLDWEQGMLSDVPYLLVSECLTQGIGRIVCGVTLSW
ncbi:major outer sheath N-terminal domain-containing protein [Treponema pallidum]|uniref:major outer sheath N-terminal domain-containing protein n=1 Tax=Treponema pallidum TaxID=160 RepID=UPI000D52CDDF|nr:major outer sheath N-terminal domain-containing protein [Treponema pallidum]AWG41172.1 Tpr protein G [Treponema pallidum subsp. pertenue]AWG41481.1 Tpr protein J [Treponema pallidum subsp. pertenue]WGK71108.1 Tpr protein J [Treponema pallidum subsp. pertenue]WGK72084.1 Tpr protein J [Treponema pallidum subsp. pertenue]WGK73743.1 Tpr protein G [Treponema pallidum subsp. pertenue]